MADITFATGVIRMANSPRVPGFIAMFPAGEDWWIYSYRSPVMISSGSVGPENGGNPYMLVALTPTGTNPTTYTYPAFVTQSTEDAVINPNGARWTFALMDNSDVPRFICYLANLVSVRIPSSPSTQNLTDLAGYNLTSLPPVTNGDRLILGDLYAVDGFFSGTVTAVEFVGGGAGLTGVTGATGGVSNTGSTTIGADTDVDSVGIISLQTRNIERVQVANDGALNALFAFNATGLSTLAGGAEFVTSQAKWSTGNIGAPSTSNQNTGSRLILYPATLGEHFAVGVESGAMWFNVSLAGDYRYYFGASTVPLEKITVSSSQYKIESENALYRLDFLSGAVGPNALRIGVSPGTIQFEPNADFAYEMSETDFSPVTDNTYDFGKVAKRWKDGYFKNLHAQHLVGTGTAPAIANGAATVIGTGGNATLVGKDNAFTVTVVCGTGISVAGVMFTVTFNAAYAIAPIPAIVAGAASSVPGLVPGRVYVTTTTTTLVCTGIGALVDSATYIWHFVVVGI